MIDMATFETADHGKIEVKRANSDGSWSGVAYFFRQDYEAEVNRDGQFRDMFGADFQVFWPFSHQSEALLQVMAPRLIGRAPVARSA